MELRVGEREEGTPREARTRTENTTMGQNKQQKREAEKAMAATAARLAAEAVETGKVVLEEPTKEVGKVPKVEAGKATKVAKLPTPAEPPRPTCTATKKDGAPCTAKCAAKNGVVLRTCVDHQPAWDRLTHEEHVAFGGWLRKAKAAEIVEVIGWWRAKQIAKDAGSAEPPNAPATDGQN